MDVKISKGGQFRHEFPSHWNAFAYVFDGSGSIGGTSTDLQHAYVFEQGDFVEATTSNPQVCCF
jgi:redox-sensitive bicupin YhaK (pirin superfamily)